MACVRMFGTICFALPCTYAPALYRSGNQRNEDENKIGCYVSEIANYLNAFRPLPEGDGFRNDGNGRNANKLNAQFFKPPGVFSVKAGSDFR